MGNLTSTYRVLDNHLKYDGGRKTVCVSTCLNYFGIAPSMYHYTSSKSNRTAYLNVIRNNGYAVRSRATELKLKSRISTLTEIKNNLRASKYKETDNFLVLVSNKGGAHLIVLDGRGQTVIDTAEGCRWRVEQIHLIYK